MKETGDRREETEDRGRETEDRRKSKKTGLTERSDPTTNSGLSAGPSIVRCAHYRDKLSKILSNPPLHKGGDN